MPRPSNSFTTLGGGVPVQYDRLTPAAYGTRGVPHTFFSTASFEDKLDSCFEQLWELNPFGRAQVITSAGAWVDKPGFHGSGRAFDLDGLFWAEKTFVTLHDGFEGRDRRLYLAVEAVLRMHFGEVLNYNFNAAHHDHFHISDVEPGFTTGRATTVYFLQNALTFVLGRPVGIDGQFGPQTSGALTAALGELGISGSLGNLAVYRQFLAAVANRVFHPAQDLESADAQAPGAFMESEQRRLAAATPEELLQNIYKVIDQELGCTSIRPKIDGAVTAFASHPDVQKLISVAADDDESPARPEEH
jgi:hypothetical protein